MQICADDNNFYTDKYGLIIKSNEHQASTEGMK